MVLFFIVTVHSVVKYLFDIRFLSEHTVNKHHDLYTCIKVDHGYTIVTESHAKILSFG